MKSILNDNPIIKNVHTVIKNTLKRGVYKKNKGRYSDCLVFVIRGEAVYYFEHSELSVCEGSLLYLPYNSLYSFEVTSEDYEVFFADFDFLYFCDELYSPQSAKNAPIETFSRFEKMQKHWMRQKDGYLQVCIGLLYQNLADFISVKASVYHSKHSRKVIEKSIDFMKESFKDPELSMDAIAAVSGISRTHFGRLFKENLNTTPKKYLEHLRFRRAKELLRTEGFKIEDIVRECGFSDVYYFNRAFKKAVGVPPGKYKKEQ